MLKSTKLNLFLNMNCYQRNFSLSSFYPIL